MLNSVQIKSSVLSKGVKLSPSLLANFGDEFLEKRRAYGNGDPLSFRLLRIPQEFYIDLSGTRLVVAANIKEDSCWRIDHENGSYYLINEKEKEAYEISFPLRPAFYNKKLSNEQKASQVVTLYGGKSLGIFAYGKCQLVEIGKPCHYCSIAQNREKGTDFALTLSTAVVSEALRLALQDDTCGVTQIMLNGGNFPDMNKSFLHYSALLKNICEIIRDTGASIEAHLIVYPPKDLALLETLQEMDISIAMNMEVFDPELFARYCPGKVATGGRNHILAALQKAVSVLGKGKVYSILVGGLEPVGSLGLGLRHLSDLGVTPIVNVLHTDPETPLEHFPNPDLETILQMGQALQQCFVEYEHRPFYENCGRNSIDTEAYLRLF